MIPSLFSLVALLSSPAWAKPPAEVNDLPVPFNVQAVTLKDAIALHWQWQPPQERPDFKNFGFEVRRQDGRSFVASETAWSDQGLGFGSYTYRIRARGTSKESGRRVIHVSDWSEPVSGIIKVVCAEPPRIELQVQSSRKTYSDIPSLRLRLSGQARVIDGCTLQKVTYRLDTGTGIMHTGLLKTNADGRFDEYVEAIRPEDEIPQGGAVFSVTATAENEAGPATSDAFTIQMRLRDRYAPE